MSVTKITIAVPEQLFAQAENIARSLNITRSQLYSRALALFIREYLDREMSTRLEMAFAEPADAEEKAFRAAMQQQFNNLLARENEQW
ncbi:MAG: hypothetical protein AB1523_03845 [Bacillota bacterium]